MDLSGLRFDPMTQTYNPVPPTAEEVAARYYNQLHGPASQAVNLGDNAAAQTALHAAAAQGQAAQAAAAPQATLRQITSKGGLGAAIDDMLTPTMGKASTRAGQAGELLKYGTKKAAAGTLKGVAKVAPWVAVGTHAVDGFNDLMNGQIQNKLNEDGTIDTGALNHLVNGLGDAAAIGIGSTGVGLPISAGIIANDVFNPFAKHYLSDEDQAKYEAMQAQQAAAGSGGGITPTEEQQMTARPEDPGVAAAAPRPMTPQDMIQQMLDDAMAYKGATSTETPDQRELTELAADPFEKYPQFEGIDTLRQEIQDQVDSVPAIDSSGNWAQYMKSRRDNAEAKHKASANIGGILAYNTLGLRDLENQRMMHGYDKRNRVDLHTADQNADINREQNRIAAQSNMISRASTMATMLREQQKMFRENEQKNIEMAKEYFKAAAGGDEAKGAELQSQFFVKNMQAAGASPDTFAALLAQHADEMQNLEGANSASSFISSRPNTVLNTHMVGSRPWQGVYDEMAQGVGPLTAITQGLKSVLPGANSNMAVLANGQPVPMNDVSQIARQQRATLLTEMIKSGKLSPIEEKQYTDEIHYLLGQ